MFKVETESNGKVQAQTIHTCLATASHHSNGVLFKVGRKNADIVFENERSVSRQHCSVRLIKIKKKKKSKKDMDSNDFGVAETDAEIEACENALDGVAVVLDDLGSKFGTGVIFEKDANDTANKTSKDDDSETDDGDETDDDERVPAVGSSQMSAAASVHLQNPDQFFLKPLEKGKGMVIPALSIREDKVRNATVRIVVGSTIFKITRMSMQFCLSRLDSKQKKEWEECGPRVGADITTTFDCDNIKYLVSPDKSTTAKLISSWALNVPTVTPDYISALIARKDAKEALPKPEDHEAPEAGITITNDAVPAKRKRILAGYKVLSLMPSEGETLCKCTGATLIPLYTQGGIAKADMKIWQNDEFWATLESQQKEDRLVVVWLDSASKRMKKQKDYLANKMEELKRVQNGFMISCIDQKSCAIAISSGQHLIDSEGNELTTMQSLGDNEVQAHEPLVDKNSVDDNMEDVVDSDATVEEEQSQVPDPVNEDPDIAPRSETPLATTKKNREDATQGTVHVGDTSITKDIVPEIKVVDTDSVSQAGRKKEKRSKKQSGWMTTSTSTTKIIQKSSESSPSNSQVSSRHNPQEHDDVEMRGGDNEIEEEVHEGISKENKKNSGNKKLKLQQSGDGWYIAAPQGKKRSKYKRSRAELSKMGEIDFKEPAETEFVQGLIVRSKEDLKKMQQSNGKTKDFKKFKKNSIIPGARMHSISQIRLVSVLPKESERQKELQNMHSDLEREQKAGDSLFENDGGGKKRGKGIRNYFSPPSSSRGRNSRRRKI